MPQASPPTPSTVPGADGEQLRSLTGAVIAVSSGLELGEVLQRLVTTAATVSRAAYGALGITGDDGRIVQFVTHGISPGVRERLGGIPAAHGVPGLLLEPGAGSLRLSVLGEHPRSVGLPPGHPPMQTFLGVPIRVHGRVFGNLYVAEKRAADGTAALFTADDEEALLALAAAAGVAVENARLYSAVRRRQRWSDALGRANHAIIARSDRDARARLAPVPAIARAAGDADLAVLAFRDAEGRWHVHYADPADPGDPTEAADRTEPGDPGQAVDPADVVDRKDVVDRTDVVGRGVPDAVTARIVPDTVVPLDAADLAWLPGSWAQGRLVPVGGRQADVEEVLVLAFREHPDPALGRPDPAAELEFGQRLGLALQVAQAQADSAALTLLRDRDRIARDLHDHVIQRLFAIGLSLQAAGVAARVPEVQARLGRAVDDIDETIKDVRRTIFELHTAARPSSVRERVDEVVASIGEGLPADVDLHVGGRLDDVPPDVAADLLAALRETLTNVARHADASVVHVYVTTGRDLELEVVDDGVGPRSVPGAGNGLVNLAERASARGGTFEISPGPDGGTVARWAVPLP